MSTEIHSGGLVTKDPDAIEVYVVDWDAEHLAASVTITTSSWVIAGPDSALTKDQESILSGSRKTQLRLTAGTLEGVYTVTNRIVTNETPAQTKDASFSVLIQQE
jgi:hypothetical protein